MNNFSMNTNTSKFLLLCEENNYNNILDFYNNNSKIYLRYNNEEAFKILCLRGNIDLIKWILKIEPNINIFIDNNECFNILCRNGHFKTFIWLYLKYCNGKSLNDIYLLFTDACRGGNIKLVKYVFSIFKDRLTNKMIEILNFICRYGNMEILKYILTEIENLENYNCYMILENCYMSENLEIIDYMTNVIEFENKFKDEYKTFLLEIVTILSNIEIIKWFINKYKITDLSFDNNSLFFNLLENDNYEGIEYLFEVNKDVKDIIKNNDLQTNKLKNFLKSTTNVNIETLKLILNNFEDINIFDNDHLFFRNNCNSQNIEVIKFLVKRYPTYYYIQVINSELIDWYIKRNLFVSENKIIKSLETCPICLEKDSEIISSCHHQFCFECINVIYSRSRDIIKCPICRASVKSFNPLIDK